MSLVAFGFGHREHGEQPAVGRGRACAGRSGGHLAQDGECLVGQFVAGGAIAADGFEDPATLEPGDRRADGGFVDAEVGEQADQRSDGKPAAFTAGVETVDGHDELARLSHVGNGLAAVELICLRYGRHRATITTDTLV